VVDGAAGAAGLVVSDAAGFASAAGAPVEASPPDALLEDLLE
jgi:hypothetical protein